MKFHGLDLKGKPIVRVAQFRFSAHSSHIIESKSFKLYLNSYNLSEFASERAVIEQMQQDLSSAIRRALRSYVLPLRSATASAAV